MFRMNCGYNKKINRLLHLARFIQLHRKLAKCPVGGEARHILQRF